MGVREALWLIGLTLVCYAVWQFFRALRAPRSSAAVAVSTAATEGGQPEAPLRAAQAGPTQGRAQAFPEPSPVPAEVVPSDVFQLQLDNSRLRQALQAQRDLVAAQQDEINRLVQDITALQDELERLREQPTSSPEYSEAMVLAAQGLNAEMIAARCGITVAEAELVLSLARRDQGSA